MIIITCSDDQLTASVSNPNPKKKEFGKCQNICCVQVVKCKNVLFFFVVYHSK